MNALEVMACVQMENKKLVLLNRIRKQKTDSEKEKLKSEIIRLTLKINDLHVRLGKIK